MNEKNQKKKYEKPSITYEKPLETLAVVCDSSWIGPSATCCMRGSCTKRAS